jgi:hypothetical protein
VAEGAVPEAADEPGETLLSVATAKDEEVEVAEDEVEVDEDCEGREKGQRRTWRCVVS